MAGKDLKRQANPHQCSNPESVLPKLFLTDVCLNKSVECLIPKIKFPYQTKKENSFLYKLTKLG